MQVVTWPASFTYNALRWLEFREVEADAISVHLFLLRTISRKTNIFETIRAIDLKIL